MASGLGFLAAFVIGQGAAPVSMPSDEAAAQVAQAIFGDAFSNVQHQSDDQNQVRVERRVIVRITPFRARRPATELTTPQAPATPGVISESSVEKGGCVPLNEIAGVRLGDGRRLLLYMRDRRVFSASFGRSCPVQVFYSGFYVERPVDGLLCAGRERLHARSGGDCMLGSFTELTDSGSLED